MIYGHGDDVFSYPNIRVNFSSNCYGGMDHSGLEQHLLTQFTGLIRSYPHPDADTLKSLIANLKGIQSNQVAIFNGATEAIYTIARMRKESINYIAGPTFSEYESAVIQASSLVRNISLEHLLGGTMNEFEPGSTVWICNPNNPSGQIFPKEKLLELTLRHPNICFVIDQSYADFSNLPVPTPSETASNVILIYSLTKQYAIPGLRLGYVTASYDVIDRLSSYRMPWSVNAIAIEAGKYLLSHPTDFVSMRKQLHEEVKRISDRLANIDEFEVFPTDTHFFLIRAKSGNAALLKETLAAKHGILIRNAENFASHYKGYFRIAVRTPEENDFLIDALLDYATNL